MENAILCCSRKVVRFDRPATVALNSPTIRHTLWAVSQIELLGGWGSFIWAWYFRRKIKYHVVSYFDTRRGLNFKLLGKYFWKTECSASEYLRQSNVWGLAGTDEKLGIESTICLYAALWCSVGLLRQVAIIKKGCPFLILRPVSLCNEQSREPGGLFPMS